MTPARQWIGRTRRALQSDASAFDLRWSLISLGLALLPVRGGSPARTRLLRLAGCDVSTQTTVLGRLSILGGRRSRDLLTIGSGGFVNVGLTIDLTDRVTVGDRVSIGPDVLVLTSTHARGPHERRAGMLVSAPVTVGSGCWLGARSTILPGVTIGDGSIVGAGAVVAHDVPANSLAMGVPAVSRSLPEPDDPS